MQRRPNIVLIMTDQQRWNSLGCYGHPVVRTPHIDRLAADGARFEHMVVPIPLCTPSRASLHTGRYPISHGLRANETFPLPKGLPTLPGMLKQSGYVTLLAGKDHLFDADGRAANFDRADLFGHLGRHPTPDESPSDAAVRAFRKGLMREKWVQREPFTPEAAMTTRITDSAISMVDQSEDAPFFLWLSYPDPHPPFVTTEPYASMYKGVAIDKPIVAPGELDEKPVRHHVSRRLMKMGEYTREDLRRIREIYYGMISFIDDQVGRFVEHLKAAGRYDNTIFIFMSDHGEYLGDHGMIRKNPALFDVLVRVPFILTWPDGLPGERVVSETMAESVDIMPTLLEWAGVPVPTGVQGKSLAPFLRGEAPSHRDNVFGCYGVEGDPYTAEDVERVDFDAMMARPYRWGNWVSRLVMQGRMVMVRTLNWKLVYYAGGDGELYDLKNDPHEQRNLYRKPGYEHIERELLEALLERVMQTASIEPVYEAPEPPFRG